MTITMTTESTTATTAKTATETFGGRRREEISISRGDYPQNLLRLSVEESAVQCTLGEMSYVLEKIYGRHVPSPPIVLGSYIAYFCSGRGGGGRYREKEEEV